MPRYRRPTAGALARVSEATFESGDGVWFPAVGGFVSFVSTAVALPTTLMASPWCAVIAAPVAYYATTLISYFKNTKEIRNGVASFYKEAEYHYLPRITGKIERPMAIKLVQSIWDHTVDEHPGSNSYGSCKVCDERLGLLKKLAPNQLTDKSDIEQVKMYLEAKREIEAGPRRLELN